MIPVSVVIVTKDEEENVGDALKSVAEAREIVVVDSCSTDRTVEICRAYTDRVILHPWEGYARQKQIAIDRAEGPWVLLLDADERVTPELREEISGVVGETSFDGFRIARKNYFLGRWIRHGGWWPDYTVRLFRKDRARMEDRLVHERVLVSGTVGVLKGPIEHMTYRRLRDFVRKMEQYARLGADELRTKGRRPGLFSLSVRPAATFVRMLILKRGFLDGTRGLILAFLYSYYTFLKYALAWERGDNDR